MASTKTNTDEASPPVANFPTEARVILQGLVKAPDLNEKKGIVRSGLSSTGRHTVYIEELDKSVALKPSNLRYEPISLESLSVKELNLILKYKNKEPKSSITLGMEKSDLQAQVSKFIDADASEELPELMAKAKGHKNAYVPKTPSTSQTQAAEQLRNMSPDKLRQEANMMRTMDPNIVRQMNPQLANMSDAQIKMAADRMEMMANNPSMMNMAAEQLKKMDPAQLKRMEQGQMAGAGGGSATSNSAAAKQASTPVPSATGVPAPSSTINQAQQAASMMQNMSPEQLRQQAQMLKTMDPDTLRRTNPQLAHMSDSQIKMAATQFEMMASNPGMMKMAMDQMKNATPEQLEAMAKGQIPAAQGGSSSSSGTAGMPSAADMSQMGGDPTEMLANMDKTQLKQMLNTVKDNPEMMKQFSGMTGMSEEQLKQGVESFAEMDDTKMDAALKLMKTAQTAKNTWNQVDAKAGGHLKNILITMAVLVMGWIAWYFFLRASGGSTPPPTLFSEHQHNYDTTTTQGIDSDLDSEF
mmetsp:Transcript_8944/g.19327  ORF Transcript_8944/g.19327 Transcript_8944/m.19327 type:complete len:526 (+) Transcript_8944:109-1686(+)|eukprot:CAMPEP_0168194170 /NCGR_PEP_ID=MMETSP0139_2-20121125/19031_1 /TAXON_ID=44445 /ORGANISM="Pseudo-nitzschia australis, Strain 10249 10 AB" /LENGTH=525 /DNA_ID=CAMNT_0008117643 /DNA_START=47 /DNA_END=1624 /DNA_ORIENTATION=+